MDNYSEYNDPVSVGSPREAFRILASDWVFPEWTFMGGGDTVKVMWCFGMYSSSNTNELTFP